MFWHEGFWHGWWWIIPVAMMILCFLFMHRRGRCMVAGPWPRNAPGGYQGSPTDTVRDILDKRYALGEIGRAEYEEKKKDLGIG